MDEVEEDLEEAAGDVDDEASSARELAEDEVDVDAMVERVFQKLRGVEYESKTVMHANHFYLKIPRHLIFHTLNNANRHGQHFSVHAKSDGTRPQVADYRGFANVRTFGVPK